jgi:hypothetical protein
MANKYIKDLTTSTTPSLTGHTIYDNGVTTYKSSLQTLRQVLVDSGSHVFTGSQVINGDLIISGSLTAQQYILSSSITNITTETISGSSNFGNSFDDKHNFTGSVKITGSLYLNNGEVNISGSGSHLAFFDGPTSLIYSENFHIIEGGNTLALGIDVTSSTFGDEEYRERLIVAGNSSHNIATFQEGQGNHYAAVNIINYNDGNNASADLVIMNDIQNESSSYVNLGLNSTNHTNLTCGYEGDAYLYTVSKDLYMGSLLIGQSLTGNGHTHLFSAGAWRNPAISMYGNTSIGFFTEKQNNKLYGIPSFADGFRTEFSGSVKMDNNLKVDGWVSGSHFVGDGSQLTNLPLPSGIVSGSSQISYTGITNVPSGLVSGSSQILNGSEIWSGSAQLPSGIISGSSQLPSGIISGSSQLPSGLVSGSSQISNFGYATTGSNTFVGDQIINGNLTIGKVSENVISYLDWVGNLVFNYGDGSIFYITGLTTNGQFNVYNIPETNDKAVTLTFLIEQGSTPYSGSLYMINDSPVTVKWVDGVTPTGNANKTDIIGLTAFRINSTWNVLGSLSTFE